MTRRKHKAASSQFHSQSYLFSRNRADWYAIGLCILAVTIAGIPAIVMQVLG